MHTEERLVFSNGVEALLVRGVGSKMTPRLQGRLREAGIDLGKPLLPAYPLETWQGAIDIVAAEIFPNLPMAEAQRELGASTVYGFEQTMLGKAGIALVKLIGPRRALLRLPTMGRSSNNYAGMQLKELAPTDFEVVFDPYVGWSEYVQGFLHAMLDVAGAVDPVVEVLSHAPERERLVIRATWR